jgi:hypothetical protein
LPDATLERRCLLQRWSVGARQNAAPIKLYLIASYVRAGRQGDAEWQVEELQMVNPEGTISRTDKAIPIADPELKRAFLDDLRAAGLPEQRFVVRRRTCLFVIPGAN